MWDKNCIFCGKKADSKEHIFAQWLHPYLPIDKTRVNFKSLSELMLPDGTRSTEKVRSGDPHSVTARVVCESCNNGWMSRLQTSAKPVVLPLVTGADARLFRNDLKNLVAWCAMFVMLAEWASKDRQFAGIAQADRDFLRQSGLPPPRDWRIWVARYVRGDWAGVYQHVTVNVVETDEEARAPGVPLPNTQSTTFVAGELLCHAFSSSFRGAAATNHPPKPFVQIWPIKQTPLVWPPQTLVDDATADAVSTALQATGARILEKRKLNLQ